MYIEEWWAQMSLPCNYYYYCVNVYKQEKEENIKIFPNPFDNYITVFANDGANITITDVLGKIMYRSEIFNEINEVSTTHFPKGVYFAKIQNRDNSIQTFKIIKS